MTASPRSKSTKEKEYDLAARRFVARDFSAAYELAKPLAGFAGQLRERGEISAKIAAQIWVLWIALAGIALKEGNSRQTGTKSWSSYVSRIAINGELWSQMHTAFGGENYSDCPVEAVLALAKHTVQHCAKPELALGAIEQHLAGTASSPSRNELIKVLALELLPLLGDYDYARATVNSNPKVWPPGSAEIAIAQINEHERQTQAKQRELQQEESRRVAEAERVDKQRIAQEQAELEAQQAAKAQALHNERLKREQAALAAIPPPAVSRPRPATLQSLVASLRAKITSLPLGTVLLAVLLVLQFANNRAIRHRLKAAWAFLWSSALRAAAMGVRVTYL